MKGTIISRRTLLAGAAVVPLAGCTAAQQAQFATDWSNFVDQVNSILAQGCSTVVPAFTVTANTIEAVVGAFYPSVAAAIAAGAAAVQAVASKICSAIPVATPAASARLAARLHSAKLSGVATFVGNVTVNGKVIPINGYGVR